MSEEASDPPPPPPTAPEEPPMEIHKPKPVHNWREFLIELGTITLGVLIALGAEQAVEWLHWRDQVAQARGMIASEMATNLAGAVNFLGAQACVNSRLDELGRILDSASHTGSLPAVGQFAQPPLRNWDIGAWQSVVASETATHFSRAELADLGNIYRAVERLNDYSTLQTETWYELATIVGPGRRLDPASEVELRKSLSLARGISVSMGALSRDLITGSRRRNLPYNQDDLNAIAAARRNIRSAIPGNAKSAFAICRPLGAAPPQYGQATISQNSPALDKSMALLPGAAPPAP